MFLLLHTLSRCVNKWYIHHYWDDLRTQFKATRQVTQGKTNRLLCEQQEPPTALHFSLGKAMYWGGDIFLLPVSSSNFSISEPWHLSFVHTDLKQKGQRRTCSDCDALKHLLQCFQTNQTDADPWTHMCLGLHLHCLEKRKKKKIFVPPVQISIYESSPNSALQPKFSVYVQTPQQQQCRFPACLKFSIWAGSTMG